MVVVSLLTFYFDDASSNPAGVYNLYSVSIGVKRMKINEKST